MWCLHVRLLVVSSYQTTRHVQCKYICIFIVVQDTRCFKFRDENVIIEIEHMRRHQFLYRASYMERPAIYIPPSILRISDIFIHFAASAPSSLEGEMDIASVTDIFPDTVTPNSDWSCLRIFARGTRDSSKTGQRRVYRASTA